MADGPRLQRSRATATPPARTTFGAAGKRCFEALGSQFARAPASFLLKTQLADGSWYVHSRRAIPLQPYFESDFPHGHDQWISAAATSWATTALATMTP